jgi:oxygen-dependent protoporphyrinogen oxidase
MTTASVSRRLGRSDDGVTVIGAGLSGLATAWYLSEAGVLVAVVDAGSRAGGLIQTQHAPEGLIETAARAFPWTDRTRELFAKAGVPPAFARDESKRRYIFRSGRARRWPLTVTETFGTAARFGSAWIARQTSPRAPETVEAWGTRVFGRAATKWLLAPALQGIYASPPAELSAVALFGKGRPRGGKLAAPPRGMGELIDRLHAALIERGVTFEFGRSVQPGAIGERPTVICTNAPAAARLLAESAPLVASALERIRMVSVVAVTAFFPPRHDDLRGFGVLFPRASGVRALGAVFNTEVFTGRGDLRSETWIFGDLDPAALPGTDADAERQVNHDRAILTSRTEPPVARYVTRQIAALPVYDQAVLDARAAVATLPGHVCLAGNYLGRLGVSSLLEGAADAADRVRARVHQSHSSRAADSDVQRPAGSIPKAAAV